MRVSHGTSPEWIVDVPGTGYGCRWVDMLFDGHQLSMMVYFDMSGRDLFKIKELT